jgi:hypothetical protein
MNIKAFKRLIKEAVAEAIYEEMPEIIAEVAKQMNKQPLTENRTLSFTSADVPGGRLPADVRNSLAAKIGASMGIQSTAPVTKLEVIKEVNPSTGEPVNPYLAFIADAAANMTAQDRAGLANLDM